MILSLEKVVPEAALVQLMTAIANAPTFRDQSSPFVERETLSLDGNAAARKALAAIANVMRAQKGFSTAVRPAVMALPALYRYTVGCAEAAHATAELVGWAPRLRADVVVLVGLSASGELEGGEVHVEVAGAARAWRHARGDCFAFSGNARQSMSQIKRGELWLATWRVQSLTRDTPSWK